MTIPSVKLLTIIGLTLVVTLIALVWVFKPLAGGLLRSWQNLQNINKEIESLQAQEQVLAAAKKNLATVQELTTIAQNLIPQNTDTSNFAIQIEDLAKANGLILPRVTFALEQAEKTASKEAAPEDQTTQPSPTAQSPQQSTDIASLNFQIQFQGPPEGFLAVLKNLVKIERANSINEISVTINPDPTLSTAQLGGKIFYKNKVTLSAKLENLRITPQTEDSLRTYQYFGTPVGADAAGRDNPFVPY